MAESGRAGSGLFSRAGFDTTEAARSLVFLLNDFVQLTKPRIIVLLLVSTCCPMVLAGGGSVSLRLIFAALLGGALTSASAGVLNCIWDSDIDALMQRTRNRPLAAGRISGGAALLFSVVLLILGLAVLLRGANAAAAGAALFGHLFYVLVYTVWLKRRTAQNIVIGGAAGAVPPIVGWVAVRGTIEIEALLIFLVVFFWTPPHFWALALNKNDDYKRAGVPMLPVVAGPRVTVNQMFVYSLFLTASALALVAVSKPLGWFSLFAFVLLGMLFSFKIWRLREAILSSSAESAVKRAWEVFGFSLIYLTLFFACLVFDSMVV